MHKKRQELLEKEERILSKKMSTNNKKKLDVIRKRYKELDKELDRIQDNVRRFALEKEGVDLEKEFKESNNENITD